MTPRTIDDGPWCWLNKDALRKIEEVCGDRSDKSSVLAVYVALCWEASNQQTERFVASKRSIADMAGLSYRKVADVLPVLSHAGLVCIESNVTPVSGQQANTYTLCTICPPLGTSCTTPCMDGMRAQFADIIEESKKNNTRSTSAPAVKVSKKGSSRTRDPIIDALASIECPDLDQVTPEAWRRYAKAKKSIVSVSPDVTPEEIRRRTAAYRRKYRDAAVTGMAIAGRWGEFPPTPNSRASDGPTFIE